jgi:hypothetical protein
MSESLANQLMEETTFSKATMFKLMPMSLIDFYGIEYGQRLNPMDAFYGEPEYALVCPDVLRDDYSIERTQTDFSRFARITEEEFNENT